MPSEDDQDDEPNRAGLANEVEDGQEKEDEDDEDEEAEDSTHGEGCSSVQADDNGPIKLRIDMSSIPCIPSDEQDSELQELGVIAYEQRSYERGVLQQVDEVIQSKINKHPESVEAVGGRGAHKERIEALLSFKSNDSIIMVPDEEKDSSLAASHSIGQSSDEIKIAGGEIRSQEVTEDHVYPADCYEIHKSDEEYVPSEGEVIEDEEDFEPGDEEMMDEEEGKRKSSKKHYHHKKIKLEGGPEKVSKKKKTIDDGDELAYQKRIKTIRQERLLQRHGCSSEEITFDETHSVDGDFKVPVHIWTKLYAYQKVGVQWLWELHQLGCGGILGDEMGLGKTIQIIAFLAGLNVSEITNFRDERTTLGPVILVTPATVMQQWVAEFHSWWPFLRVAILHNTGSFRGKKEKLVRAINQSNGILITSYCSIVAFQDLLYKYDWHYVILDEGHKIRNPDAQTTLACKRFRTPHRLILSGSPIQNNLKELWSLFDFIYPGKLGTLPVFMEKFAVPITQGGYANASQIQVEVAYKCATVLRDAIKPYLLRRVKDEVQMTINLPNKNEQVLFCRLTDEQRDIYKNYLESPTVRDILKGKAQIFVGLINLRKICNHPDIYTHGPKEETGDMKDTYGYYKRSGKMKVVDVLLRLWHKQEHKVLLFTQGKQMLTILEIFLRYREYTYLKMDGTTAIGMRQQTVSEFNSNRNIFVFLLTTRVGGIGLNLIGADRVIIFDPDWNPTTDMQARERAWRIGQEKQVTIYRLLTAGTVEEKIYHRQVFKQYLTNRVLKDPKQRRFFKTNDLYELFTLGTDSKSTESSALFAGTGSKVKVNKSAKNVTKPSEPNPPKQDEQITLPPEKIKELQEKAKKLSKMIGEKFAGPQNLPEKPETIKGNDKPPQQSCSSTSSSINKPVSRGKGKKTKGTVFEGKRIKYLVKSDVYSPGNNVTEEENISKQQDDYVLKKLFKKSNMHSALQHDVIEGAATADFALVESEADKVANEAIKALRRSREMCLGPTSGIPTWTGRNNTHATSNRFGSKRKDKPGGDPVSSKSLIQAIKERNKFQDKNEEETGEGEAPSQHDELLNDIRNYVAFQARSDGEATTQEILERFKDRIPASLTPVFKSLLWKICDFFRRSDGTGVWKIKGEFR